MAITGKYTSYQMDILLTTTGAQLRAPARGWMYGLTEYYGRLNSTLSNYFTCRDFLFYLLFLSHRSKHS